MNHQQALLFSHHNQVQGIADQLYDYLTKHFTKVIHVSHPLDPNSSVKSYIRGGSIKDEFKIPLYLQFFLEAPIMLVRLCKLKEITRGYQLAICIDPLSYLHAKLLKRILKINKIIYYNVDYSTQRFSNKLLNWIYQKINLYAFHDCDIFFYITSKFLKDLDSTNVYASKSFRIRHIHNINKPIHVKKITNSIIFCGNISYSIEFSELLSALKKIKESGISFSFDIFGSGDKLNSLKSLIKSMDLDKNVHLKGNISHQKLIDDIIPKYILGVAPYITKSKFSKTAANHPFAGEDLSTKIIEYIGLGLPVISTRPFKQFNVIEKHQFGFLVKDSATWYKALLSLLTNKL